jgi:hypothetical protein
MRLSLSIVLSGRGGQWIGRRKRGRGRKQEAEWDQIGAIGDLNESSHVYVYLFPLVPHWRNSDIVADESECGCGTIDTSPIQPESPITSCHANLSCLSPPWQIQMKNHITNLTVTSSIPSKLRSIAIKDPKLETPLHR